jgi:type II secretory pathway component PulF
MELEEEIKRDMISVSILPAVALTLIAISSTILFLYVLPMIIKAIGKVNEYPFFTRMLLNFKDILVDYKYGLLLIVIALIFLPKLMRLTSE